MQNKKSGKIKSLFKKLKIKHLVFGIVILIFVVIATMSALSTWYKPLDTYMGVSYLSSYWDFDDTITKDETSTSFNGSFYQPLVLSYGDVEALIDFDLNSNTLKAFDSDMDLIDELTFNDNLLGQYVTTTTGYIAVLTGKQNGNNVTFNLVKFNSTDGELILTGSEDLSPNLTGHLFNGNDVICDNKNIPACYFVTSNYSLVSVDISTATNPYFFAKKHLLLNSSYQCSNDYHQPLYHSYDLIGDGVNNVVAIPINYNCSTPSGDVISGDIVLYKLSNTDANISTQLSLGEDIYLLSTKNTTRYLVKPIMWDYDNAGYGEVYVTSVRDAGAILEIFNTNMVSLGSAIVYDYSPYVSIGSGRNTSFTSAVPIDIDEDNEYEFCMGYGTRQTGTNNYRSIVRCYNYDLTVINNLFGENPDLNDGYIITFSGLIYNVPISENLLIADLNNDNYYDFIWGRYICYDYNLTFYGFCQITTSDAYVILGSDSMSSNADSGWIISDMNKDGNPEIYGNLYNGKPTQYSQAYNNSKPTFNSVCYDTGTPICINKNRTYYSPSYTDLENDYIKMKVICDGNESLETSWSGYSSSPQRTCVYTNYSIGVHTDIIIITDISHSTDEDEYINYTYEVAVGNCYNTGYGGECFEAPVITTVNFTDYGINTSWANESLTGGNYTSEKVDFDRCSEYKVFYSFCPVIVFFETFIENFWDWFWDFLKYLLVILAIALLVYALWKKRTGKGK